MTVYQQHTILETIDHDEFITSNISAKVKSSAGYGHPDTKHPHVGHDTSPLGSAVPVML